MNKKCKRCGKEMDSRGFNVHLKYCKSKEIKKELKTVKHPFELSAGLMDALNDEVKRTKEISSEKEIEKPKSKKDKCNCGKYDGSSLSCPIHKFKTQCPECRCVDTGIKQYYMEPCNTYRCSLCGFAFQLNLVTGDYIYA